MIGVVNYWKKREQQTNFRLVTGGDRLKINLSPPVGIDSIGIMLLKVTGDSYLSVNFDEK
jgi:hypothetical protein